MAELLNYFKNNTLFDFYGKPVKKNLNEEVINRLKNNNFQDFLVVESLALEKEYFCRVLGDGLIFLNNVKFILLNGDFCCYISDSSGSQIMIIPEKYVKNLNYVKENVQPDYTFVKKYVDDMIACTDCKKEDIMKNLPPEAVLFYESE